MNFSPDDIVFWQGSGIIINATLIYTWVIMAIIVLGSILITWHLSTGTSMSRWQNLLEVLVKGIRDQIQDIAQRKPDSLLPFIGTLFIFILISNLLAIIPGYLPPTGSISTTTALALCVFVSVPLYGIRSQGLKSYLAQYFKPSIIMLPFNVIGEFSRTLALAVRLFGNMMSGTVIIAILLGIVPLFFPVVMQALGLLTGVIQAYIFAILATVYIAAAMKTQEREIPNSQSKQNLTKGENHYG